MGKAVSDKKTKKRRLVLALTMLAVAGVLVGGYFLLREWVFGHYEHIEGDDIEIITNRFRSFSDISDCYYQIDLWNNGLMAPTHYNIRAIVVIDQAESARLMEQYDWIPEGTRMVLEGGIAIGTPVADVQGGLYEGIGMEAIEGWLYCKEFDSDTFDSRFVGEAFFSKDRNCIYIDAASN